MPPQGAHGVQPGVGLCHAPEKANYPALWSMFLGLQEQSSTKTSKRGIFPKSISKDFRREATAPLFLLSFKILLVSPLLESVWPILQEWGVSFMAFRFLPSHLPHCFIGSFRICLPISTELPENITALFADTTLKQTFVESTKTWRKRTSKVKFVVCYVCGFVLE